MVFSKYVARPYAKYATMVAGVLIFEIFTGPMWHNYRMGAWSYVYTDVSWVLTLGWSSIMLTVVYFVDHILPKARQLKRFVWYLVVLTGVVFLYETILVSLGVRSYAPEVQAVLSGYQVGIIPIEFFYYIPVFGSLVISFYKYWELYLDQKPILPVKNPQLLMSLVLAVISVVLFEIMIDPVVENRGFPEWSYFYRDLSIVMTLLWVAILWISTSLTDKLWFYLDMQKRFILYLIIGSALFLPLEMWFINNGNRLYGPSAQENFTGFTAWGTDIPLEVVLAIPFYLALMIGFIRFWELVKQNRL